VGHPHPGPSQADSRGGGLSQDRARLSAPATGQKDRAQEGPVRALESCSLTRKEGEQSPPEPPAREGQEDAKVPQPGALHRLSLLVFLIVP